MVRLAIVTEVDKTLFCRHVEDYYNHYKIIECKFQRNLFYALDDGKGPAPQRELKQEYVAFIVYKELEGDGTRYDISQTDNPRILFPM